MRFLDRSQMAVSFSQQRQTDAINDEIHAEKRITSTFATGSAAVRSSTIHINSYCVIYNITIYLVLAIIPGILLYSYVLRIVYDHVLSLLEPQSRVGDKPV